MISRVCAVQMAQRIAKAMHISPETNSGAVAGAGESAGRKKRKSTKVRKKRKTA